MRVTKVKEIRTWSADDVRAFCIRERLYTRGTNEEYDRMLQSVIDTPHPRLIAIVDLAEDIYCHSDRSVIFDQSESQTIANIANMLANEVLKVRFEVEIT